MEIPFNRRRAGYQRTGKNTNSTSRGRQNTDEEIDTCSQQITHLYNEVITAAAEIKQGYDNIASGFVQLFINTGRLVYNAIILFLVLVIPINCIVIIIMIIKFLTG